MLPIELARPPIESPRTVISPALIGGICLSYQGFVVFLPANGMVLQIDWDESQLPALLGIKRAFMGELNKLEGVQNLQ